MLAAKVGLLAGAGLYPGKELTESVRFRKVAKETCAHAGDFIHNGVREGYKCGQLLVHHCSAAVERQYYVCKVFPLGRKEKLGLVCRPPVCWPFHFPGGCVGGGVGRDEAALDMSWT